MLWSYADVVTAWLLDAINYYATIHPYGVINIFDL